MEEGQKKFVEFSTCLDTWDKRITKKGDATPEEKTVTFLDTTPTKKRTKDDTSYIENRYYCLV